MAKLYLERCEGTMKNREEKQTEALKNEPNHVYLCLLNSSGLPEFHSSPLKGIKRHWKWTKDERQKNSFIKMLNDQL